jgi:hypothetical protein
MFTGISTGVLFIDRSNSSNIKDDLTIDLGQVRQYLTWSKVVVEKYYNGCIV